MCKLNYSSRRVLLIDVGIHMDTYNELTSLSAEEKRSLYKKVKKAVKTVSRKDYVSDRINSIVNLSVTAPIGLVAQLILPFFFHHSYITGFGKLSYFWLYLLGFSLFLAVSIIPKFINKNAPSKSEVVNPGSLWVLFTSFVYVVLFFGITNSFWEYNQWVVLMATAMMGVAVYLSIALPAIYLIGKLIHYLFVDRFRDKFIGAELAVRYLHLLRRSEKPYQSFTRKRSMVGQLTKIAAIWETEMPARYKTTDPRINAELRTICTEIAATSLQLSKLVAFPGKDSRGEITKKLSKSFVSVINGDIGELERSKIIEHHEPRTVYTFLAKYSRALLVAVIPLGLYLLNEKFLLVTLPADHAGEFKGYVIGWAVINIALMLDPGLNEKVAAVKMFPIKFTSSSKTSNHGDQEH